MLCSNYNLHKAKCFNIPVRWLRKRSVDKTAEIETTVTKSRRKRSTEESYCAELDPEITRVKVVKGSQDYNADGTTIKVQCAPGYRLRSSRSKFRCKGGVWRPGLPHCELRDCPHPTIHHAEISMGNGTVSVTCHSGYRLTGPSTITCSHGRWEPQIPVCLGVPCLLPQIIHGTYHRYRSILSFPLYKKTQHLTQYSPIYMQIEN